jgi:hypothetical protein
MDEKQQYINSLRESLTYSITKFDAQTLTISGASLAFSLTFIKEIVPFKEAICIPVFYTSLSLFIITIFLGLFGHYLSMKKLSNAIDLADKEKYDDINNQKDYISIINVLLITSIIGGIILLIIYCIINIENQRKSINLEDSKINSQFVIKDKNITISTKEFNQIKYIDSISNKSLIIKK